MNRGVCGRAGPAGCVPGLCDRWESGYRIIWFRAFPTGTAGDAPKGAKLAGGSPKPYIRNTHYPAG